MQSKKPGEEKVFPIQSIIIPNERLNDTLNRHKENLFGLVAFQNEVINPHEYPCPVLNVDARLLNSKPLIEVWVSQEPTVFQSFKDVYYCKNDDLLFGKISMPCSDDSIERDTQTVYQRIVECLDDVNFPYLHRMWNYFPHINVVQNGLDCYQRFCIGREKVFHQADYKLGPKLPAATVIGTQGNTLDVLFIGAKNAGVARESKRQTSAYHYPKEYGPSSPSFSRALLHTWPSGGQFYISGTASIVGHKTLHVNDVKNQLLEIGNNLRTLVTDLGVTQEKKVDIGQLESIKVYLRHIEHHTIVSSLIKDLFGENKQIMIIQGDICRRELLIEIECILPF